MSYSYDTNPWDENYSTNTSQPVQSGGGYGGYYDGYSNPMAQYPDNEMPNQDQQQAQQPPYAEEYDQNQSSQQAPPKASHSWLRRFISQHIPFCGTTMDILSSINLPFIDALFKHVNRDLLVSKMFYFFFYSAFGSLFPLMGVYFKQLGMNPSQVGILTGVRPFIEIFSAPFWNSLAERFHKSKALLLFSLISWIVFTYSLCHIRPPASACVAFNDTDYVLYTPYSANDLSNYEVGQMEEGEQVAGNGNKMELSSQENEMFLNKMSPQATPKDKEGKVEILASEENQNDQRRKRRRKRQVSSDEIKDRYRYTVGDNDDNHATSLDLGIDLENDFNDILINSDYRRGYSQDTSTSVGQETSSKTDRTDYDGLGQMKEARYKRSLNMKDVDDVLGETDDPADEEPESNDEKREQISRGKEKDVEDEEEEEVKVNKIKESDREKENKENKEPVVVTTPTEEIYSTTIATNKTKRIFKQRHKTPPTHIVGMSPITVEYAVNYNKERHGRFVTPMFSTIVYKLDDIKEVFFLLLLLISLGEFFSAPAVTIADSATLSYLGANTDLYGRQRMYGSVSWAITLLLVGMALDNATSIADHPCGPHQRERSYTVCFTIFSLLMACAFLTATQFRFDYPKSSSEGNQALVASTTDSKTIVTTTVDSSAAAATGNIDELYASTQPRSIFNTAPPINAPPPGKEKFEYLDKWKSAVFAQKTWEVPEWVNVFRQFRNSLHLTYLFITWFLGCGVGLVFTFLFWHLQDVGGTPTLFGICSVINHISEILAYFFSFGFIKRFGHTRVLSFGLGCNVIRFLYVAFLTNPYYALPFELVQGITHAACFAACCSYISHVSKPELRTSTLGVMQGLHHGIGRACGALIGGYMINAIGSRASFCIYGLLSGCVLAGFLYVRKRASQMEDEELKVDDSDVLGGYGAPQGVPSAIPQSKINQTVLPQDTDYQW